MALLVLGVIGAARLQADAIWLQPERFTATPGAALTVEVRRGETFGAEAILLEANRLGVLAGSLDGQGMGLFIPPDAPAVRLMATLPRPGVAVIRLEVKPELRTLPRDRVDRYLLRAYASDEVCAAWADLNAPTWREWRTFRAKTFLRVGEPSPQERAWNEFAPAGLDIVPEKDPTAVWENGELPVCVREDGRPIAGILVGYVALGEEREHVVATDADGRATARLDAPGPWLVQVSRIRRVTAADHDWNTEGASVTVSARGVK